MALNFNPFEEQTEPVAKKPKAKKKRSKKYEHFKAFESSEVSAIDSQQEKELKKTLQPPYNHPTKPPHKDPTTTLQPPHNSTTGHTLQPPYNHPTTTLQKTLQPPYKKRPYNHPTTTLQKKTLQPPYNHPTKFSIERLSRLKKRIMLVLFQSCLERGERETGFISSKRLAIELEASLKSIEGTIKRLKKNEQCIKTVEALKWRSGGTRYRLSDDAYDSILRFHQNNRLGEPPYNHPTKDPTNSSSSKLVKEKNKTNNLTRELIGDFQNIQTPEFLKSCSFGKTQLLQIQEDGLLTASEVQESLEHFVADYEQGKLNIKTNPLSYLMGILRKQAYISASYLDDQRKEQEAYLAKVQASKRAEEEMQKILLQKAFEDWEKDLTPEDKAQYVEYNEFVKAGSEFEAVMLRGYFEKNIYNKQEGESANTPD